MKKVLLILLAAMLAIPALAGAETYYIQDESGLPADWAERETLRLTFVDTDRSDAIILQCGGEAMMVDGGFNTHYKRVFATLDAYGITTLRYLLSTHCDGDHSGGLTSIINSDLYAPGVLLCPNAEGYDDPDDHHEKMVRAAKRHNVPYQQVSDGYVFTLGAEAQATITIIRCEEKWGQNARSAACRVDFNGGRILLLADVSNRVMNHWMDTRDTAIFDADVVKAPHHGIDGMPADFLEVISPAIILCTNEVGSDHNKALEDAGALYSGDGTVIIETDGTDWYVWQHANWGD